ncbi:MAG: GDSL-type esterase/lipase family protein [Oscillospiraceae bacterium]|nr:GDSL-type esterase/lipase family protein [Oscillospiraceae bacterium]
MNTEKQYCFAADSKNVRISGRSLCENNIRYLSYTNSFVEFEFMGTAAYAELISDLTPPEDIFRAWAGVCINGEAVPSKVFKLDEKKAVYELYRSDKPEKVRLRLMKLSEAAFSKMGIAEIRIEGELLPPPAPSSERRIEFVGDSITCGYGIDGVWNKDVFSTETENPIKSYAYKTANKCHAEFHYVSWSGMGVYSNWVEDTAEKPLDDWLVTDIYPYTDSPLERSFGRTDFTKWDFSAYVPQVIVFNMGTNDQSWTKHIEDRCSAFCEKYYAFLEMIRKNNPDAYIVCTYGIMGTDLLEEETACTERFKKEHDDRIKFVPLPVQEESDGIGADWHPSEISHEKMSCILSKEINAIFESMGL